MLKVTLVLKGPVGSPGADGDPGQPASPGDPGEHGDIGNQGSSGPTVGVIFSISIHIIIVFTIKRVQMVRLDCRE